MALPERSALRRAADEADAPAPAITGAPECPAAHFAQGTDMDGATRARLEALAYRHGRGYDSYLESGSVWAQPRVSLQALGDGTRLWGVARIDAGRLLARAVRRAAAWWRSPLARPG